MQVDAGTGGSAGLHALADQAGNEAGEHIPHTPGGHARVAGGIDKNGAVRPGDHRCRPLEHQVDLMLPGKRPRMADSVTLNVSR
jgi:hypothetical protein